MRIACALSLLFGCFVVASVLAETPPDAADSASSPVVHDAKAAQELESAFGKLEKLKSYRLRSTPIPASGEPLVYEVQPPDAFRMLRHEKIAGFSGTSETISKGGKIAFRFVSPDLDAHLAEMEAAQRTSFMTTLSGSLAQIAEAIASGGVYGLGFAADQAALLAAAVRERAKQDPEQVYGRWQCLVDAVPSDSPVEKPEGIEEAETVERLSPATSDGENVVRYRSVSTFRSALNDATWSLDQRIYVLERSGLPIRVEMDDLVFDYFDFEAPLAIEFPSCEERF